MIDLEKMEENLGTYRDDVIKQFLDELPGKIKAIEESSTYKNMAYAVHNLKGVLNIIGVDNQYVEKLQRYEDSCLDEDEEFDLEHVRSYSLSFCHSLKEELNEIR